MLVNGYNIKKNNQIKQKKLKNLTNIFYNKKTNWKNKENATNIHKRVELGELAAAKLFKVEPHNFGNYMLLSNIYALAGRRKDVGKVRDKMRKQGVKKTTAMSWVEHNS